ncbi:MAG: CBS domain-containing protein [Bacillota bacterium]|jgi:acetoin utilization protein AcuB
MLVRSRMTPNPITVSKKTTIAEALELIKDNKIRRLPVVDRGKLIGIVTDRDLSQVSPSPATTLSIFELNYLLAKTKIGDILPRNQKVVTVSPDDYLEQAALLMRENAVGGIPVIEQGQLVGIITESDIFDAFIEIMGVRQSGLRIHLEVENRVGVLAEISQLMKDLGVNITHTVYSPGGDKGNLLLKLDTFEEEVVLKVLKEAGFEAATANSEVIY